MFIKFCSYKNTNYICLYQNGKQLILILKTNQMKAIQTILNVIYTFNNITYNNYFILFEGDNLKNLLPPNAKIISINLKN
jgi:hypothetical protein